MRYWPRPETHDLGENAPVRTAELRINSEGFEKDLDGDDAVEPRVTGFVNFFQAAGPQGGEDFVRAEAGAGREGQSVVDYKASVGTARWALVSAAASQKSFWDKHQSPTIAIAAKPVIRTEIVDILVL